MTYDVLPGVGCDSETCAVRSLAPATLSGDSVVKASAVIEEVDTAALVFLEIEPKSENRLVVDEERVTSSLDDGDGLTEDDACGASGGSWFCSAGGGGHSVLG